jgi:anti-sigma B factor antagonist
MDIEINEHLTQGFKVITLKGRIDAYTSVAIEDKLNGLMDANLNKFIVDMGQVDYLGSSGIRIFISFTHRLNKSSGSFAITNLIPSCLKILQSMGIEHFFHIFDNEKDAVRFLQT